MTVKRNNSIPSKHRLVGKIQWLGEECPRPLGDFREGGEGGGGKPGKGKWVVYCWDELCVDLLLGVLVLGGSLSYTHSQY